MNGFIIFGIMFMTATGLENSPQSFGVYTVLQYSAVYNVMKRLNGYLIYHSVVDSSNFLAGMKYSFFVKQWADRRKTIDWVALLCHG